MQNLLIGNGLNLTNYEKNSFLSANEIGSRFVTNLIHYWPLIEKLINAKNIDLSAALATLDLSNGIEILAGQIFEYIFIKIKDSFNWNYCYRLIEILGEISIKSIFFKNKQFMIPEITHDYISAIEKYDNIFSLNYIEDWDIHSRVIFLHGNLTNYIQNYCDIGSNILSHNNEYQNFKKDNYQKINFLDIVFMPSNKIVNKYNYIKQGLVLNKCGLQLYPTDDLFSYDGRDLYSKLDNIDSIEIFGMSPYGDESLIRKIKQIKKIKIYVYNKNPKEIDAWINLGINAEFIDSKEFLIT